MTKRGTDWGSLVAGLLFLGLAVAFVVQGSGSWELNVMWLLPVLAVGLGLAALARALFRSRPRESGELPPPTDQG
ncbi:mechanosensitive ion channel family protein [Nocardiopsis exhalans]|uniref:Mechanosensitive ion channel family protein n=1 Tax=Nocardiopsis exhalans TaxID=163604 RepID=A0ABY5DCY0_9ACTN|nr:mechanosensitive ion channel family protein [Nocardiopsis exhalans]USY21204.1 mechanosensitive ion channel family protein [Nocardiopsis exhalans]